MVSIQEFARLCRCSTQTLRYYDRIGLFHPKYVDASSGYRYYSIEQSEEFFRIKELQEVGFSIKEIRQLKELDEEAFLRQLDQKITMQEDLLAKTRALKETYQKRKRKMEEELREYAEKNEISIQRVGLEIMLKRESDVVSLRMSKDVDKIADLLQKMQAQSLIELDLCVFREQKGAMWESKGISDWITAEEAVTQMSEIPTESHPLAVHLFLINETITLRDIQRLIESMMRLGYGKEESLFSVSLALDDKSSYCVLYPV